MSPEQVQEILDDYVSHPEIPLKHHSHYTLLIAVLLSAQATDVKVNEVTPHLFRRADTAQAMALLSIEEIEQIIRSIGLAPKKARAIKQLSLILVEQFGGEVPETFEELESLPGVGHKTASVVMIQAFHRAAFPVDTHIFRSARRWGLSTGKSVERVEADLKRLFPEKDWAKLHLQMILFARKYCPAKRHDSEACPMCNKREKT